MRLNRYLSECGLGSRRKVEEFILQGRVEINGKTIDQLAYNVEPGKDAVTFDGEKVKPQLKAYYLLNKPKGFVTTTSDEKNRRTVMELIKSNIKVFPVGRLDYNTTGVLILTNDGDFTNYLLHPNNKVRRVYRAVIDRPLEVKDKEKMLKGLFLDGRRGRFEEIIVTKKSTIINVTAIEGRNHFVKKMFQTLGYNVVELSRINYGGITLGDLPLGGWRELTAAEINSITKKYEKL
ncbi:MAG: pseudouridine synthase [Bacteroidota bacterium]|nr:rRNA pseudouridine synthase [Ignavibacteria bacterium]MCU7499952.1 rRNA pseudouridine synthase [Ignavibacteria bacterium]MCU7513231.1 rRNA pseudouridine synthase [Ignavibacteria bacterium]MCU7521439.1 rRNA pseudouridine synthase [Ignavibacteria bacterium]MCU7525174.1 rRNA pseudouridine synthase [Ignavibacteria bacterium]